MALTDGLYAYWTLDEATGDFVDVHGATDLVRSGVTAAAGLLNGCGDFEASASQYASTSVFAPGLTNQFSLSFWVNLESVPTLQSPSGWWNYASNGCYGVRFTNFGEVDLYILDSPTDGGSNFGRTTSFGWTTGVWYHGVVVFDGTLATADRLKLYVNGVQEPMAMNGTYPATCQSPVGVPFYLGRNGSLGDYLDGLLDEVGFWSRALSALEVAALYNDGVPFEYPFVGPQELAFGTAAARGLTSDWVLAAPQQIEFNTAFARAVTSPWFLGAQTALAFGTAAARAETAALGIHLLPPELTACTPDKSGLSPRQQHFYIDAVRIQRYSEVQTPAGKYTGRTYEVVYPCQACRIFTEVDPGRLEAFLLAGGVGAPVDIHFPLSITVQNKDVVQVRTAGSPLFGNHYGITGEGEYLTQHAQVQRWFALLQPEPPAGLA